jgi:hypothetical protein
MSTPARDRAHAPGRLGAILALAGLLATGACDSSSEVQGPLPGRPRFDGARALELVRHQVAFGPRVPGLPGHAEQLAWMRDTLGALADDVVSDSFTVVASSGDTLRLTNVVARFRPEDRRRILLLTHWDTRPTSDEAREPERRSIPVPGANDGGSGTAVLIELARLFRGSPPPMGIDLLFVDGEDYGPEVEDMLFGSKRYAESLSEAGTDASTVRPIYGVLLDMVGDADAHFPVEGYSFEYARPVVRKVWGAAHKLGYGDAFPETVRDPITDDHVPLIEAGIPTADVIDLSYGPDNAWWHTPEDTPDRLSAASLEMVGEVMAELVYAGG